MRVRIFHLLTAALVFASCFGDNGGSATPGSDCNPMPADRGVEVEGLIVPPGTALLAAKPTGQKLTHVRGFIPLEPVDVRKYYERLQEDEKSYEFFLLEDEVIEAEAFFTDGTWRNYIKALVLCEGRSKMIAYVAPEDYGDEVNEPRASPSR